MPLQGTKNKKVVFYNTPDDTISLGKILSMEPSRVRDLITETVAELQTCENSGEMLKRAQLIGETTQEKEFAIFVAGSLSIARAISESIDGEVIILESERDLSHELEDLTGTV